MSNDDPKGMNQEPGCEVVGCELLLTGRVQGVGMRPAVWRLAKRFGLKGGVRNEGGRVRIRVWGRPDAIAAFRLELLRRSPPGAAIERVQDWQLDAPPPENFRIDTSRDDTAVAGVPADAAVCGDCLAEVFDPQNRRYRYPFAHCARCGPRFTVLERLPYDRGNTRLKEFPLCHRCRKEYADPEDRRFHAEAIACPDCGPRVWTWPGTTMDPVGQVKGWLRQGRIVAVKGVGGFHLVADAAHVGAVGTLRARKHRPHKPLALMARDMGVIRRYCRVSEEQQRALLSPERPIVLLETAGPETLPATIAPGLEVLGFMLPYTPLHHLLLEDFSTPLVFTSANPSGAPLCMDNDEALENLEVIADAFLFHDREIVHRCDDSVVRQTAGRIRVLRSGRGYAPVSLALPPGFETVDPTLALGGELKNTFCLLHQGRAVLSQHLGDLADARTFVWYREEIAALQRLFGLEPRRLAIDLHPGYLAGRLGRDLAEREGIELTEVQHHYAHLAACLAEYGYPMNGGPVLGLIPDGLGFGEDGAF